MKTDGLPDALAFLPSVYGQADHEQGGAMEAGHLHTPNTQRQFDLPWEGALKGTKRKKKTGGRKAEACAKKRRHYER